MAGPAHDILEGRELFDADGPARMEPAGRDADLGAEAEFAAVGELRRSVVQHDGAVDAGEEALGGAVAFGDDAVGVLRSVARDVGDRLVEAVDGFHRDDGIEKFAAIVVGDGGLDARIDGDGRGVATDLAAGIEQRLDERRQEVRVRTTIDEQAFGGAADAGPPQLAVEDERNGDIEVGAAVDVGVAYAFEVRRATT